MLFLTHPRRQSRAAAHTAAMEMVQLQRALCWAPRWRIVASQHFRRHTIPPGAEGRTVLRQRKLRQKSEAQKQPRAAPLPDEAPWWALLIRLDLVAPPHVIDLSSAHIIENQNSLQELNSQRFAQIYFSHPPVPLFFELTLGLLRAHFASPSVPAAYGFGRARVPFQSDSDFAAAFPRCVAKPKVGRDGRTPRKHTNDLFPLSRIWNIILRLTLYRDVNITIEFLVLAIFNLNVLNLPTTPALCVGRQVGSAMS
ncbi:hypothetical protein B0H19DRAFT_1061967 [Mycena capillaripes]|nr:hypothetical protein B0H19DRAFT_1061967 [Mycena capillaripes]